LLCGSWPESIQEHLPTSIAGVLRLRAIGSVMGWISEALRFRMTVLRGVTENPQRPKPGLPSDDGGAEACPFKAALFRLLDWR
jgi:hypothetical protein